jgi:tetratricopeptide (TPR) repeat protein
MSPDGKRVAAAFADNTIWIWPVGGGKPVSMTAPAPPRWGPRFSPDGRRLAAAADRTVTIWDVGSGTVVWRTPQLPMPVSTFIFSPDGQSMAVGYQDRTIGVWEIGSRQAPRRLAADGNAVGWPLTFDAGGRRLVAPYADGRLRLWNARSSRALLQLDVGAGPPQRAAFTSDGRRLLLLGSDSTTVVFDALASYDFDARQVVDQLFDNLRLSADVIAALDGDPSLARPVRDAAIRLAQARGDDPMDLFGASQAIAWSPGHSDADYRRAVRYAEAAARAVPSSARFTETLGLALFRVGRYRDSVAAFRRADSLRGGPDLPGMIFLAMAFSELGDEAQAQAVANEFAAYAKRRQQMPWNSFEAGWWSEITAYKQALDKAAGARKK